MLVKFHSSTSGEIFMFAETARQVLAILDRECRERGVVTLEQLPDAISLLTAALARAHGERPVEHPGEPTPDVSLAQRLVPIIDLLQRTLKNEGYVMWQAPGDFGAG